MPDHTNETIHEKTSKPSSNAASSVCSDLSSLSPVVSADDEKKEDESPTTDNDVVNIDSESSVCASLSQLSAVDRNSPTPASSPTDAHSLSLVEDLSILAPPNKPSSKIQEQNEDGSLDDPDEDVGDAGESVCQDLEALMPHRHGISKNEATDPELLKDLKEARSFDNLPETVSRRSLETQEIVLLQNNSEIYLTHHPILTGIISIFGIGGLVTVLAVSVPIGFIILSMTALFHFFLRWILDKTKHPIPMAVAGGIMIIMILYIVITNVVVNSFKTECCDGTYSSASGSGACSHHGGIAANGCKAKYKKHK